MQPVKTLGKATLYRKESFCGRTTPIVEWIVKFTRDDGKIVQVANCQTRKQALEWLITYSN